MTSITWAGPRCVQEAAAILGPQNRTQGRCDVNRVGLLCTCKPDGNEHGQTKSKVDSEGASHLQLCVHVSLPELFSRNHFLVPIRKWKTKI